MTRRITFSLLMAILLPLVACAKKVSEQEALQIAQSFMKGKTFALPSGSRGVERSITTAIDRGYYVFNDDTNGGFVIVSADDLAPSILGYSDNGNFDLNNVPENVAWLLDYYEQGIKSLNASSREMQSASSGRTSIEPLIKTQWGQEEPYNDLCPMVSGVRCYTGCTATAIAQIVNYHRWPVAATSAIPAYTTKKNRIKMPKLPSTTFDWDAMGEEDIARLCLYCGQALEMDYDPSGSAAALDIYGINSYFGYDPNARYVSRSNYSESEWTDVLYNELSNHRPILYSGSNNNLGHAFVCDGYDANSGMFHFNWGWKGNYDGYYVISLLHTMNGDFSDKQSAVIGIRPNSGYSVELPVLAVSSISEVNSTFGRSGSSSDFTFNSPRVTLQNTLSANINCDIGFRLYKNSTPVSDVFGVFAAYDCQALGLVTTPVSSVSLGSGLSNGTYRLVPVHRFSGTTANYVPAQFSDQKYFEVRISGNTMTLTTKNEVSETAFDYDYQGVKYRVSVPGRQVCAIGLTQNNPATNVKFQSFSITGREILKGLGKPEDASATIQGETIVPASSYQFTVTGVAGNYSESNIVSVEMDNTVTNMSAGICFMNCDRLKTVKLSDNITEIGEYCFYCCENLQSVNLPSSLTKIGCSAFNDCYSLRSIVIPDGLKTIGEMAFASCEALSTVTISSSSQLESIGPSAFELCSFTKITLPATLRSIGDGAFWVNDDIEVHSFITTPFDPKDAFGYGENNVLYIPAGTRSLYDEFNWWYCFENIIEEGSAVTLTAVNCSRQYGEANPTFGFTVSNGTLTSGSPTITCSATATSPVGTYDIVIAKGTVGNETVNLVNGTLTITKAPLTISAGNYSKVEGEDNPAFTPTFSGFKNGESKNVLTKQPTVTTTATKTSAAGDYPVTVSGAEAQNYNINYENGTLTVTAKPDDIITFADAEVKRICVEKWDTNGDGELSETEAAAVTDLGLSFGENKLITSFNELQFFTNLKSIGTNAMTMGGRAAFYGCSSLTSLTIPSSVTSIRKSAFYGCSSLTSLTIPSSVTSIECAAFAGCSGLTSLTIPSSVTSIADYTFQNCSGLTSLTIPSSVTSIGYAAFSCCSGLTSITVDAENKTYDSRNSCNAIIATATNTLVAGCKTTIIPSSVTSIADYAFSGCSGLTSLTIPSSVTSIGYDAFYKCSGLIEIKSLIGQPFTVDAFSGLYDATILYVPIGTMADYKATDGWKEFKNIVEMGDANGDGQVDYGDATSTINHIIGQSPAGFDEDAADMNNDGKVDIVDVAIIIENLRQK